MVFPANAFGNSEEKRINYAQFVIDDEIMSASKFAQYVKVRAVDLRIDKQTWDDKLKPQYIAAGWKTADWEDDYIVLTV